MTAREAPPSSSLLGELAGQDVDDLIREARAEARAAVKGRLRDDIERALSREVEDRLAPGSPRPAPRSAATPPAAPAGMGLWVYGAVRGDFPGLPDGIAGVADGAPPRAVRGAGTAALVSEVPLSEFGEDALKRNLNDLEWLERVARAHENVLEAALAGGAVVPMRVCTIFRGEEQVRRMLTESRAEFEEALDGLTGTAEWGVKVVAEPRRVAEIARSRGQASSLSAAYGAGDGGAYLGRKREDRDMRELVDTILEDAVREIHARLEEWASASELLPPQRPEVAEYDGEMILNGAYLVDDDRTGTFAGAVAELSSEYEQEGLSFDLTGPWPPFHFVGFLGSPLP